MNTSPRIPQFPAAWWAPVVLLAVIGVVYASQLVLVGQVPSFGSALAMEVVFWISWSLVAWPVFRLCRFLHAGSQDWRRYVIVLSIGVVGAMLLFPTLFQTLLLVVRWVARAPSLTTSHGLAFWPTVRGTVLNLLGPTAILYVATVLGWHAVTFYRDLKERQLKAVELESLLHQAQLEALRSQLQPHFLFNTLHSIAELVHENPPLAEQLILRLAELLRQVLKTPVRQEVPLHDEIEFIRGYVEIEQIRLGDRLTVEWDMAPETLQARVPSLVLQPLVENAIQHGVAALTRPGRLTIRVRREASFLHLQVRDTGPGLQPEQVSLGGGIGLANTADRLKRLYGADQRFELLNQEGLVVDVRIPFTTEAAPVAQSS